MQHAPASHCKLSLPEVICHKSVGEPVRESHLSFGESALLVIRVQDPLSDLEMVQQVSCLGSTAACTEIQCMYLAEDHSDVHVQRMISFRASFSCGIVPRGRG